MSDRIYDTQGPFQIINHPEICKNQHKSKEEIFLMKQRKKFPDSFFSINNALFSLLFILVFFSLRS